MGDAQTPTGQIAWVTWGAAALGAHLLLLCSVPSLPVESVIAAASTVAWEVETWEALAPSPSAAGLTAEQAAIAAPMQVQPSTATSAPAPSRAHRREPVVAQVRRARTPATASAAVAKSSSQRARDPRAENTQRAALATNSDEEAQRAALEDRGDENAQGAASPRYAEDLSHAAAEPLSDTAVGRGDATGAREQLAAGSGTSARVGSGGQGAGALLRGPRLLATHDPCAGFFPGTAQAKRGQVQLSIDVDAEGHPHPMQTLLELPLGQGFESAAKACATHLHFAPALDAQGHPVSARARIALRFERS